MPYLFKRLSDRFNDLVDFSKINLEDRETIALKTDKKYSAMLRNFTEDNIADTLSIGYKYKFFKNKLNLPYLDKKEKEILYYSLVSADLEEDKSYIRYHLHGLENYFLDGIYSFRLRSLTDRWNKITEYIPLEFSVSSLDSFMNFVTEEGVNKVFLKKGKVYDENYNVLKKTLLCGEYSPVGEIILAKTESVYAFDTPEHDTMMFLKKYYSEKLFFC